jgi:hypothetical protein
MMLAAPQLVRPTPYPLSCHMCVCGGDPRCQCEPVCCEPLACILQIFDLGLNRARECRRHLHQISHLLDHEDSTKLTPSLGRCKSASALPHCARTLVLSPAGDEPNYFGSFHTISHHHQWGRCRDSPGQLWKPRMQHYPRLRAQQRG